VPRTAAVGKEAADFKAALYGHAAAPLDQLRAYRDVCDARYTAALASEAGATDVAAHASLHGPDALLRLPSERWRLERNLWALADMLYAYAGHYPTCRAVQPW
jgi:hypothetical protein